jgi:hypothetical protein
LNLKKQASQENFKSGNGSSQGLVKIMINKASVKIIDNKKVWMTNDEYLAYQEICKGYDRPNFQGKDLFQDHFEVNDDGVIIFVKPPHKKYSSMEVFTFLISLMVNQQLRISQEQISSLVNEAAEKYKEQLVEITELKKELLELKKTVEQVKNKSLS